MKISGSLEDVGIAEVLQVIHFGTRTGRLTIVSLDRRAEVGFVGGQVAQAWATGVPRLGDLLVRSGTLLEAELDAALAAQRAIQPARALGRVLLDRGAVSVAILSEALARQVEDTIREIVGWRQGSFSFDVAKPGDPLARPVVESLPGLRFDVPALLSTAAVPVTDHDDTRPFLRRPSTAVAVAGNVRVGPWSREALAAELSPPAEALPGVAADRGVADDDAPWPEIRLHSRDQGLFAALSRALAEEPVTVTLGGLHPASDDPALVVVDARGGGSEELASIVRRVRPVAVVAVVAGAEDTVRAYEAGVVAVVPPEVEAMAACVRRLARAPRSQPEPPAAGERAVVERLRRFLDDVRSGLYSATVSLSLMNIVAESAERGILFLARHDGLAVLGAFGAQWPAGTPLATLLRDFRLEDTASDTLRRFTLDGACQVSVDELPEALMRKIGPPRSATAALVPVVGQSLVALVYADNGTLDAPLRNLDLLEVATAQVGLAFENELLRQRLRARGA